MLKFLKVIFFDFLILRMIGALKENIGVFKNIRDLEIK